MLVDDLGEATAVEDQTPANGEGQAEGTDQGDAGQGDATASGGDASTNATADAAPKESIEDKVSRLERALQGTARGYQDQQSLAQQVFNQNKTLTEKLSALEAQLAQATSPKPLTQEEWAELYSDPQKGEQYIDARAARKAEEIAGKIIDKRLAAMSEDNRVRAEYMIEGQARTAVAEFARKINLTEDEFREVHERNPFLQDLKPQEYQRAAVSVMKGEYADRVMKTFPARAADQSKAAQDARLKNSAASATSPVNAGRSSLTPSQEWMSMLREHSKVSDI